MLFYIIHRERREKECGVVCGSDKYSSKDVSDGWGASEEDLWWKKEKEGGERGVRGVCWVGWGWVHSSSTDLEGQYLQTCTNTHPLVGLAGRKLLLNSLGRATYLQYECSIHWFLHLTVCLSVDFSSFLIKKRCVREFVDLQRTSLTHN